MNKRKLAINAAILVMIIAAAAVVFSLLAGIADGSTAVSAELVEPAVAENVTVNYIE